VVYDANKNQFPSSTNFDICIIGAGAAGITIAAELVNTDLNVCLLDAGDEGYSIESQGFYKPQTQPELYEDTTYNRLRMLGGSTNHWENNTSEFMANDFLKKEWSPNSGWPVKLHDIQPYYAQAAMYCGTDADGYDTNEWHSRLNKTDPFFAVEGLVTGMAKSALPPTRFYYAHKTKLMNATNITIIKNANLVDIEADLITNSLKSATFSNYKKAQFKLNSDKFVFSMGGIENARMLLILNEKYSNRLGNQNDLVGRYFMDHPLLRLAKLYINDKVDMGLLTDHQVVDQKMVVGFMQHTNESILKNKFINLRMPIYKASQLQLSDGIESMHVLKQALSDGDLPEHTLTHILNTLKDVDSINESIFRRVFDSKFLSYVDDFEGYEMPIMLEQLPHYDNRIALGDETDSFGLKKHMVYWKFHDEDLELGWKSLKSVASQLALHKIGRLRIMQEYQDRLLNEKLFVSHHHMGTTRMASNQSDGVVDENCKVFNTENLYVAGSSIFVTGSHVPPTLTLVAFAIRLAEHLKSTSQGQFS
jgi:choline dehydrogenase-like flavoprotein